MKILYVPFLLFACQLLLTTATGSYYLTTRDSKNDSMPNLYKLQCRSQPIPQDEHDGMKWLFNGSNYTMSSCFAGAVLNENTLTFNHSSDCDGYIQCGDGTEYSHPFKLIADPEYTPFFPSRQINIKRPQGSSVTLPCNFIISATGGLNVRWKKNNGTLTAVSVPLNEDYSITLTNLEYTPVPAFYFCEINNDAAIHGHYFYLTVVIYRPPHITEIIPSNDEDGIEIVLSASGTNLKFSWFLDNVELNDSINGVEINNEIQSTLQLSHNIVMSAKNLRAFASNIDTTNSSDLRGMGSGVVRNRSDSVQLWLYPVSVGRLVTTFVLPTSDLVCEQTYMHVAVGAASFLALVLIFAITINILLCCKLYRKNKTLRHKNVGNPESSSSNVAQTQFLQDIATVECVQNTQRLTREENMTITIQRLVKECASEQELINCLCRVMFEASHCNVFKEERNKELKKIQKIIENIMEEMDKATKDCIDGHDQSKSQGENSQLEYNKYEKLDNWIKGLLSLKEK